MELTHLKSILFVIVIYKRSLRHSETFLSLEKNLSHVTGQKLDLYIYDNSPEPQPISKNEQFQIIYEHDASNSGVSKAYNMACLEANKIGKKWILIFDQDTTLPLNSIKQYCMAVGEVGPGINVIAPKLYSNNVLLSPCRYIFHRGFHLSHVPIGNLPIKRHSFLNSGLLIKVDSIKAIGFFDEKLFDYSDHDFFLRFVVNNTFVNVIDLAFIHGFSGGGGGNPDANISRFKKLTYASRHMARKYSSYWPIFWLTVRAFKLFLVTKNSVYLFELIKKNASEHV